MMHLGTWGLVLLVGTAFVLSACNPFESKPERICELRIKERLKSPSSYKLISSKQYAEPVSVDEYIAYAEQNGGKLPADAKKSLKAHTYQPKVYHVFMSYDAQNSFGATIRNLSLCEYVAMDGSENGANDSNVYLEGENEFDHTMNGLRAVLGEKLVHQKSINDIRQELNRNTKAAQ
jgi:hypothetical protein